MRQTLYIALSVPDIVPRLIKLVVNLSLISIAILPLTVQPELTSIPSLICILLVLVITTAVLLKLVGVFFSEP